MGEITVEREAGAGDEPMRFRVVVGDGGSSTEHDVTVSSGDLERLAAGRSPEAFVRACFGFLWNESRRSRSSGRSTSP